MDKPKIDSKTQKTEERIVDTSAEHVKELEDELLKLRIEDAFLKELRRLRLEDEAKMRRQKSYRNSLSLRGHIKSRTFESLVLFC